MNNSRLAQLEIPDRGLLTRAEVARIFRVSPSTVTRWADAGKLPVIKTLGGHRRYDARAIKKVVQTLLKEETNSMEKVSFDVPRLFGDHHVIEIRRILLEIPGVESVYASSAFRAVEINYDPARIQPEELKAKLDEAGYLGTLPMPEETDEAVTQEAKRDAALFFRHTAAYAQTGQTVGFAQKIGTAQPTLWPCPGVGVIKNEAAEEDNHG